MIDQPEQSIKLTEAREIACKYADKFGNINELSKAIQSFAKQEVRKACEKQRDMCAKEWNLKHGYKFSDTYDETVMSEIRNAPQPKI